MKWEMEKSEKFLTDQSSCEDLSSCKTKAVNGVAKPNNLSKLDNEEDTQSSTELSHNLDVKTLKKLVFSKFNHVTDLNMVGNSLEHLPDELTALCTLKVLNVSCNNIVSISESVFSSLQCLKILNLSTNRLTELPVTICNLKNLKILNLSHNSLSHLPCDIGQLRSLELLDVSSNYLQTLPPSLENSFMLYTLNISCNILEELPECILNLKNVVKLNLSHNKLISFDRMLSCCYKLVNLNLSHNNLVLFPSWLFEDHCMWLKEVNLSYNRQMEASTKSSSFNTCVKYLRKQLLKSLNVSNCKLTMPMLTFLEGLQGLEVLDLGNEADKGRCSGNAIWALPSGQLSLSTRLRKLVLCNVGLTEFPEDVKGMSALDVLDLSGNDLSFLPPSFCKLKNLRHCILSRNHLDSLPSQFGMLASLEELWVDGNKLCALPESFGSLKNLRVLDLYNNTFCDVPSCLKFFSSLQAIDLELNFFDMRDQGYRDIFSENYQVLKANLRQNLIDSRACRIDGPLLKHVDSDSECCGESGDDVLEGISNSDSSETSHEPVTSAVVIRQDDSERSCWDDEAELDDNFDPNERGFLAVANRVPATRVNPLMFPRNFCPVDMHFQGIYRRRKLLVTEPVEAQFEDSPFDDTDVNPTNISYLLNEKL